jgi:transposase
MQRAKTDAVDAGNILDYLERMPFNAWRPPAPEILELQAITRRIVQLHTELTREKNRRHASEFAGASADAIAHDIEVKYPAPGATHRAHARKWPATRAWRAGIG